MEAADEAREAFPWPIALGAPAVLLLAIGAILLIQRRRRSRAVREPDVSMDDLAVEEAHPSPPTEPVDASPPVAPPPPPPVQPIPAARVGGALSLDAVGLRFEPRELRLSLVYATLAYEVFLTNSGQSPRGPLRLVGGMISAHASLDSASQLAPAELPRLHDAAELAPGSTVSLRGQVQLPLSEVRVIADTRQPMFVPLVRLRLETDGAIGSEATLRVFAIGLAAPGAQTLAPVRLDLGPRSIRELGMVEVEVDKWLPADALRRAAG